ncbi:unnamed protein product [Lathyrus sativus]|nr:unnamed protein product [Lathyrus sativus]
MTYNIQTSFEIEGYFSIKATPLGDNLCLLEESEHGEIRDLIREAESWWRQWFSVIREWKEEDLDKERVTWLRCYRIPFHAWNFYFFELLAKTHRNYVCVYDNTLKEYCMDVSIIMVMTNCAVVLNETFKVQINDEIFSIKMIEDSHDLLRLITN